MQKKGYDVTISYPKEGVVAGIEAMGFIKGAKHPELAKKFLDWASTERMQKLYEENGINLIPSNPHVPVSDPALDISKIEILPLDVRVGGQKSRSPGRAMVKMRSFSKNV